MMANNWHWRVSHKQAGMRLLQFLRDVCSEAPSVKALKRAIDNKLCTVNRHIETFSSYTLQENDDVALPKDAFDEAIKKIPTLFEDEDLLIVNKPVGFVCEASELKRHFKTKMELVHRLDKETSGVLILAKKAKIKEKLMEQFKQRVVRKVYLALVDGTVKKDEDLIDNHLGKKHCYQGQTIYAAVDSKKGQRAITFWKCLKRGKEASLLSCEPRTGRTHQLRVHLSGIGHPILGDVQYAKRFRSTLRPKRNMLHAYSISFAHPTTGKEVKVVAPIPADFKQCMDKL